MQQDRLPFQSPVHAPLMSSLVVHKPELEGGQESFGQQENDTMNQFAIPPARDQPPANSSSENNEENLTGPRCWEVWQWERGSQLKLFLFLIGLVVAIFTAFDAFHWLMKFAEWSKDHEAIGISAFIGIYIVLTVLLFPAALLTIIAGLLFGVWKGTLAVLVGASLGSTCAFLVGRYLLKEVVDRNITRRFKALSALNTVIKRDAFKFTFLVRLSPVVPFNWLNYGLSVTSVPLLMYVSATFLGMIPGAILFVYLGSTLMSFMEIQEGKVQSDSRTQILFYVGLGLTLVVTVVITRLARNQIRKEVALSEAEAQTAQDAPVHAADDDPSHPTVTSASATEIQGDSEEAGRAGVTNIKILTVREADSAAE